MKAQSLKLWDRLRSSFWFLPALMSAGAVALAFACITLEEAALTWFGSTGWLFSGGAEGASAVLGTIASSMITIAGVVFSVTLVALTLTSQQFGPRLLRNFTRDTSTHLVMGTFVATFLYCILVLRSVRYGDEEAFVPHLSVTVAVVLAVASAGVLIYFIHHISAMIQADEIVARVGQEFIDNVDKLFPERAVAADVEDPAPDAPELPQGFDEAARSVWAAGDGYVQAVDYGGLVRLAQQHGLLLKVEQEPGSYVAAGQPLVTVAPGSGVDGRVTRSVREAFALGSVRTGAQDLGYAANQLVEICVRALSPSMNDPFTAIRCIDRLGSGLSRLTQRRLPDRHRRDAHGAVRLVMPVTSFAKLTEDVFRQVRPYAVTNPTVSLRLLDMIGLLARSATRDEDRTVLALEAELVVRGANQSLDEPRDVREIELSYQRLRPLLEAAGNSGAAS